MNSALSYHPGLSRLDHKHHLVRSVSPKLNCKVFTQAQYVAFKAKLRRKQRSGVELPPLASASVPQSPLREAMRLRSPQGKVYDLTLSASVLSALPSVLAQKFTSTKKKRFQPAAAQSALPELSTLIYRRRSTSRTQDNKGTCSSKTPRFDLPPARGIAVRIPLIPTCRNGEDLPRREQNCFSVKSISPLKERLAAGKGKSGTPGPRAGQENLEPSLPRSRQTTRKWHYQRVKHLFSCGKPAPAEAAIPLTSLSEPVLKWQYSARLAFQRRSEMSTRPLLIVQFTGVLGDFFSPEPWASSVEFFLRPGWVKGLRSLAQSLQVVLYIDLPRQRYEKVEEALRAASLHVDAVYRRRKGQPQYLQDYSQTLYDFGVKGVSASHVMVLSALNLDQWEIDTRKDWSLLYESSLSEHRRLCTAGLPAASNNVSLCWLVPNPRAQEMHECIGCDDIAGVILKFLEYYPGNLLTAFGQVREKRPFSINACVFPALDSGEECLQSPAKVPSSSVMRIMAIPKGSFQPRPYLLIEDAPATSRSRHRSFLY